MEQRLGITDARKILSKLVERVRFEGDSYIIERHGQPSAAIVPIEVYELWKRQRDEFFALVRRVQDSTGDPDPEQVMQDVLDAQRAVRELPPE